MKAVSLTTRDARKRLAARHPPYWHKITRGISVGYRNTTAQHPTWYARVFLKGSGYVVKSIGTPDDAQPADGSTVLSWKDAVQRALALNPAALKEHRATAKHTLDEVADRYFAWRRAQARSPDGLEQDLLRWRVYIKPKLGGEDITKLTTDDLQRWLEAMVTNAEAKAKKEDEDDAARRERQRKAKATANRVWTILRAVFNHAFRKQKISLTSDTWRAVDTFKKVSKPRKLQRKLSLDEAFKVLKVLDPEFVPLATAGLYTGMRLGELMAMRVADVKDGEVYVPPRKTAEERDVALTKEGAAFFASLTKGRPDDALVLGLDDSGKVGKARRVQLGRKLREAYKAAGIKPMVFHDLRRSYGSLLLNSGMSISIIADLLGHADERMTSTTYAFHDKETRAKAVQKHLPSFKNAPAKKKRARKSKRARS